MTSIAKNNREEIRIEKSTFKGKDYLNIRIFVKYQKITDNGKEEEFYIPTKKGIMLPFSQIDALLTAIEKELEK